MRFSRTLVLAFLSLLLVSRALPQQTDSAAKNAAGIAVVQRALTALGQAQGISDSLCTGTLTLARQPDQPLSITIKSKGTQMIRTESTGPEGTTVRIVNHGIGAITNVNGSVRRLLANNTFAERVGHIPALSLLSEALGPQVNMESQAAVQLNGSAHDVVEISYAAEPGHSQLSLLLDVTRRKFFINKSTGLVSKVEFIRFSETKHITQQVERQFSDYRQVGPLRVPFYQQTYVDGRLESSLQLTSVQLNMGLQDAEFAISE